ncbi:MAG: EamA family transporter [Eggerthellaceae bacterium]|jgi:multidrug transporter EmrE-like cation transporter|nr:EamA family transporter [Eggerthellaceae bacterium]MCH4220560.1 EamA family transporter [Eggerthellaceae bacterium]
MASGRRNTHVSTLLGLHILLGVYSLSDVCSKLASGEAFPSWAFIGLYLLVLVLLGVYAIGWQQVIKRMPLSSAYANRAVTVIWGLFWGVVLFGETITPGKIIGALLIVVGIALYARIDRDDAAEDADAAIVDAATCDDATSNSKQMREHDGQPADQHAGQKANQPVDQPVSRQANQSADQLVDQPADQPANQPVDQPVDQQAVSDGRDRL